jgi:hypothetical protein
MKESVLSRQRESESVEWGQFLSLARELTAEASSQRLARDGRQPSRT